MHTFAHVLINQLAFECGYGSASLRERIYCEFTDKENPMSGVLIYTASGDSEGSMGGLVRQGQAGTFENIVLRAIQRAAWCSSDPVCIESSGQGADSSNLAACHGCALLPETSCEEGNRLLDRAMLTGTPLHPEIGFFPVFYPFNARRFHRREALTGDVAHPRGVAIDTELNDALPFELGFGLAAQCEVVRETRFPFSLSLELLFLSTAALASPSRAVSFVTRRRAG